MEVQALKEQLSEKELRVYELELYAKELNAQIKELSDAKEKIIIANRNARTLEEENSNLIIRLKSLEQGRIDPAFFPAGVEAAKLVKENKELRASVQELKVALERAESSAKAKESDTEKQLRTSVEECDRMAREHERQTRELANVRRHCVDLQRTLDEERDTAKVAAEVWDQERQRYTQKLDELLAAAKRAEGLPAARDARPHEHASELQELLLKEEVDQLEKKLRTSEERFWAKEKEWLRVETNLKADLANARQQAMGDKGNETGVYRVLQDQVATLKREIMQLRTERRAARPAPYVPTDSESSALSEPGSGWGHAGPSSVRGGGGPAGRIGGPGSATPGASTLSVMKQVDALSVENAALRDQVDDLKKVLLDSRLAAEEKNVRVKELEVLLATANAKRGSRPQDDEAGSSRSWGGNGTSIRGANRDRDNDSERSYGSRAPDPDREIADLRRKAHELQGELAILRAAQEQKDAIGEARLRECQGQIDELLHENEALRGRGAVPSSAGADGDVLGLPEHAMSVMRLSKDKRDSVEDVMRLLESSWANESEALLQARYAKMQGAAVADNEAVKDDEIRRLQAIIGDLRDRLSAAEGDRNAMDDLRDRIRDLEDENSSLKKKVRDEERFRDRSRADLEKEMSALRAKFRDLEDNARSANDRTDGLQRQLKDVRDENSRLRRQMARSPRRDFSASNRSPERVLSQLSVRSSDERKRSAVPEGAHLAVTVVELSDVMRNGRAITEPGYVIIKLKSIKEKYKTTVKELSSVIRFDESFEFYLAQPDQDVITLHVFYKPKDSSREYHIGDACFSMATLYRGVPRERIAPVAQSPGSKDARRAAQIEVRLQTDDFGKMIRPTEVEVEDETLRFDEMVSRCEMSAPERLHAVDVYLASSELA